MTEQTAPLKLSNYAGFIKPERAAGIFDDAARLSAFQRLIPRQPLGPEGKEVPVVTKEPVAHWTKEGQRKKTTDMQMDLVNMSPEKLACITVLSAEVVRADPGGTNRQLRRGLANAFAKAFDYAVGHGLGGDGTGTGPFAKNLASTSKSVTLGTAAQDQGGIHQDLVSTLSLLVNDGRRLTGWALDMVAEPILLGATDKSGRPLFVDLPQDEATSALQQAGLITPTVGRLFGRPSVLAEGVGHGNTVGFAGNFAKAAWGVVGGISYRISTEATVTIGGQLTSLFEHNLVAVLAEAEYGFVVADEGNFVKLVTA